ncbi:MAG TPA: AAA family ATPase [Chloroflexota bacterium]
MLLRFEVSNHRSIFDPVELSMIAVDEDRSAVRRFDLLSEGVLTTAGIYGPNASGKSNVLDALVWLSAAVGRSLRAWDEFIPRDPFKFGDGPEEPSVYEVDMVVDGIRYIYRVELDELEVNSESLYSYPKRQPRALFDREGSEIRFRRGLGGLAGGTRELLTPTTLALSAAMRFNEPEIQIFGRHLRDIQWRGFPLRSPFGGGLLGKWTTRRLFDEGGTRIPAPDSKSEQDLIDGREPALALLRFADLGIDDVQLVDDGESDPAEEPRRRLRLVHRVAGQEVPFELDQESAGTQMWFRLIGPMLSALRNGQIMLFDEIDASLHPKLSARLLELFQDPVTNPHGAQLIFTTHDTSLLNHLNRDEVWLTEKGEDGATTLTALAEYGGDKVRRSLNLERAYLQGRFGAVPELDQLALRHALGLLQGDELWRGNVAIRLGGGRLSGRSPFIGPERRF